MEPNSRKSKKDLHKKSKDNGKEEKKSEKVQKAKRSEDSPQTGGVLGLGGQDFSSYKKSAQERLVADAVKKVLAQQNSSPEEAVNANVESDYVTS